MTDQKPQTLSGPRYTHSCPDCVFVDSVTVNIGVFDVYRCPKGPDGPTWVARFNDDETGFTTIPEAEVEVSAWTKAPEIFIEIAKLAEKYRRGCCGE